MLTEFLGQLWHYLIEVTPALLLGFALSGIVHEFVPEDMVRKYLGKRGVKPILGATLIGIILPICCFGSLPVAISFHKKGARLGPVLAFLVATPATSVTAILVSLRLLGLEFTIFLCLSVILVGLILGLIGNLLRAKSDAATDTPCPECQADTSGHTHALPTQGVRQRLGSVFNYAFIDMPKHIGLEMLLGLVLAAAVASIMPLGQLIRANLSGFWGYPFSLVFGVIMYICSTASVPLVDAFIRQGMNIGAGMILLLVGPVTSYGALLVLRKHFGGKILLVYLLVICISSLILGFCFYNLHSWMAQIIPQWMLS